MNFQESIQVCFKKYADFTGRATRPEYWWFVLFLVIGSLVTTGISEFLGGIFAVATLVPSLAAGARRLHDTNRTGWWQLIGLIPMVGWIVLIVLLAQPGQSSTSNATA
ncbi:DUF805 domain-containing protein [Rhizobacter sp. Root1221]|uniref:DUF805 domain-containing protein n=1 Tax=Rhizobacter sp. Root1221 TaxID=1736433 RepID=UPI0006FBF4E7|nr:DUF805 domain-containing protein [Rhizobacter sp. Root1221]KQV91798.1 hypothetical protein ASC87_06540 [Rhizobacter sp. Root1221]